MILEIHRVHFLNAHMCICNSALPFWDISQRRANSYHRTHTVKENKRLAWRVTIMLCGLKRKKALYTKQLSKQRAKQRFSAVENSVS